MQNTGKTDDFFFCSVNNLMQIKFTFRLSGISDCKHQSDDDEKKIGLKILKHFKISNFDTQALTLRSFQLEIHHI